MAKPAPVAISAADTASPETHRMRISTSGKLSTYVRFAVTFLQENPGRPLVLHTLPPEAGPSSSTNPNPSNRPKRQQGADPISNSETTAIPTSSLHSSTLAAPRLVTVVELVKREYMAVVRTSLAEETKGAKGGAVGKGKGKDVGLWQYTESGVLPLDGEENKSLDLADVLGGKSKPKMLHHPYLQVTLSTRPLALDSKRNIAVQVTKLKRGRNELGPLPPSHEGVVGSETETDTAGEGMIAEGAKGTNKAKGKSEAKAGKDKENELKRKAGEQSFGASGKKRRKGAGEV